ncbi:MAG: baseplate wedge protein 53 [Candidatus Thiodiazotropha taylori]|uniref:Baseplate wedge protein 53 n=1 Tax=Candidatus Thiodiazotropha taylori TaxID=2792791 RepID=A0A9E4K9H5_9GAMM|nr:baseplate wedge protein 53 [Candidatus Thiodiazotropha taylori]MCW4254988.1 baseplate wedge protein 53 [Candidatus Thiodiazotropha taylori]
MYFKTFPYVDYPFPDNMNRKIKNLSLRPAIHQDVFRYAENLERYIIQDGETPETIAYDKYGSVDMHWIIMLANTRLNLYKHWPKSTAHFQDYVYYKYKFQKTQLGKTVEMTLRETLEFTQFVGLPDDQYTSTITRTDDSEFVIDIAPPYFEDVEGKLYSYDSLTVTKDAFGRTIIQEEVTPLSYYDWEMRLNDELRELYIPTIDVARRLQKELKGLMNE